jgi:hypothetical protein|tara:strand:- start:45 stop:581 length:537 start_codon:yes stop_codon:yes gene_type:complete
MPNRTLNIAYADPPYIGQAEKHYSHDPNCAEVDHKELVEKMCDCYDGWALSLSSPTLPEILPYCPPKIRIGAWVKPFCAFKKNVNPAYAWEPVIFWGGRRRTAEQRTVRDYVREPITMKKGLTGVKPEGFCFWVFLSLGMAPDDVLHDLYPGTGAVGRAWDAYCHLWPEIDNDIQLGG